MFDRATGAPVWGKQFGTGSHLGGMMQTGAFANNTLFLTSNAMVDADGVLYVPTISGALHVLNAAERRQGRVHCFRAVTGDRGGSHLARRPEQPAHRR